MCIALYLILAGEAWAAKPCERGNGGGGGGMGAASVATGSRDEMK